MGAITDKLKGTAKKIEGRVTGDKVRMAQGKLQESKGDVELGGRRVASKVKAGARKLQSKVQRGASRARSRSR
ncbi:hypothetical protein BH11MYX3_BH11MYX3_20190 [soil metagenome]